MEEPDFQVKSWIIIRSGQRQMKRSSDGKKKQMENDLRAKDGTAIGHEFPTFTIQISTWAFIFLPFNCCKHQNVLIMMQTPPTYYQCHLWQLASSQNDSFRGRTFYLELGYNSKTMQAMMPRCIWRYGMMRRPWCGWYESSFGQLTQMTSWWYLPKLQMPCKLDYEQTHWCQVLNWLNSVTCNFPHMNMVLLTSDIRVQQCWT